jgi:hypothetical protein
VAESGGGADAPSEGASDGNVSDVGATETGAEGGADAHGEAAADGGGADAASDASDAGADASDAAPADAADAAPYPIGTLLQTGYFTVYGVTTDGYAIYRDYTTGTIYAARIDGDGGAAQTIATGGVCAQYEIDVVGNVVLAWPCLQSGTAWSSTLVAWTSSGGAHTLSSASNPNVGLVSPDGSYVVYADNVTTFTSIDITASAPDGTNKVTLLSAVPDQLAVCSTRSLFVGTRAVIAHCDAADAGNGGALLSAFDSANAWARVDIARTTNVVESMHTDSAGTKILVFNDLGTTVFPLQGDGGTKIDDAGVFGWLTGDGQNVIYGTYGYLARSPVASPSTTFLYSSATAGLYALSPSEQTLLFHTYFAFPYNLVMTSAVSASGTTTLSSHGGPCGPGFTADSTHALFIDTVASVDTLKTVATVDGGSPVTLASAPYDCAPTSGATVLFNSGRTTGSEWGRADIDIADTSLAAAPTRFVGGADLYFRLTPAKDKLVYTWSYGLNATRGLYIAPLP